MRIIHYSPIKIYYLIILIMLSLCAVNIMVIILFGLQSSAVTFCSITLAEMCCFFVFFRAQPLSNIRPPAAVNISPSKLRRTRSVRSGRKWTHGLIMRGRINAARCFGRNAQTRGRLLDVSRGEISIALGESCNGSPQCGRVHSGSVH